MEKCPHSLLVERFSRVSGGSRLTEVLSGCPRQLHGHSGGLGIRQHSTKQQITRYSLRPWRRFIPSSARVQVTELALPYSESALPRYL